MATTTRREFTEQDIIEWVERKAKQKKLRYRIFPKHAKRVGEYLYLPMALPGIRDAGEFATKLQQIEDSWNNRRVEPNLLVFLEPASAALKASK